MLANLLYYFNLLILIGNGIALSTLGIFALVDGRRRSIEVIFFGFYFLFASIKTFGVRFNKEMGVCARWFCYTFGIVYSIFCWHVLTMYNWWTETRHNAFLDWHNASGPARELKWHDYVAAERIMMENMYLFIFYFLFLMFYPMAYQIVLKGNHRRFFSK